MDIYHYINEANIACTGSKEKIDVLGISYVNANP